MSRSPPLSISGVAIGNLLGLPNQVVFWTVIFVELLGTAVPGLNFGAAIICHHLVRVVPPGLRLMVVVGRAWCAMCPFGGFAEWIQRRSFWKRTQKALGLGRTFPEPLARLGFLVPVASFLLLTWIEEFFNIAGPGNPADTSWMVVGIVGSALTFFLVFERRTFGRYVCPLSTLIGTVGAMGSAAGFRTRDREVCLSCRTKDCMRGGDDGYGCPWYTWPGSADSNLSCGLCSECFKSCPEGNVGLYLQRPMTSVIAPRRRRADVAWGVAVLWGLVICGPGLAGGPRLGPARPALDEPGSFVDRRSRFRAFFVPIAYGLIPVVGADYFARQLPKFFKHATRLVPAVGHLVGHGSAQSTLYTYRMLGTGGIVAVQVAVVAAGTLAAAWATWRIAGRELVPVSRSGAGVRRATQALVLGFGTAAAVVYVAMHAAS